ncbi:uncharacterized protein F4822DRAFT_442911 [Hypoxylon trugodes]|uniref:uncharacterized protein n=1 Tax=Hypoxylon trugodes TaxID=326681 RepID=UPI00218FB8E6|nr:uncharacterized protein F4822DRAFT_442911 [Hypoxylon trugodes]KAI1389713.1 hypothetical protein F4822DRAFT_442911 [Hypoxylon trugodes]
MSVPFPSIQSFFSKEVPPGSQAEDDEPSNLRKPGDGFTSSEIEVALNPLSRPWEPSRHYEACPISLLETGPHNYQISGRIVNFSINYRKQGFHLLIVTDGTGAIAVKIYYFKESDYQLLLGQRVAVWTTFISGSINTGSGPIPFCALATALYPGRNGATHIIIHSDEPNSEGDRILRRPLEYNVKSYEYLPGLMTLKAFLSTGYDLGEGKILVCVRSVGPRRTIQSKKRQDILDMVEVGVFDDTEACVLKLWEDKVPSAKSWVPNQTILLISKPTHYTRGTAVDLGIAYNSMVDVDPDFPDANWLRTKVKDMAKKQSIYTPFPSGAWDAEHGAARILFTLADVEEQVRHSEPKATFTGKLNVIIFEMKLMENWRKGTACYFECCGIPLYANKAVAICKNCQSRRELEPNPRIIGSVIDESGAMAGSKLVWRPEAWSQLFFGGTENETQAYEDHEADFVEQSWEDLTLLDNNSLRAIEEQLLYSRVTLAFGWSSELERLCILGVEW